MPLKPGPSHAAMSFNYKELGNKPRPRAQKIAIMLKEAGKSREQRHSKHRESDTRTARR